MRSFYFITILQFGNGISAFFYLCCVVLCCAPVLPRSCCESPLGGGGFRICCASPHELLRVPHWLLRARTLRSIPYELQPALFVLQPAPTNCKLSSVRSSSRYSLLIRQPLEIIAGASRKQPLTKQCIPKSYRERDCPKSGRCSSIGCSPIVKISNPQTAGPRQRTRYEMYAKTVMPLNSKAQLRHENNQGWRGTRG